MAGLTTQARTVTSTVLAAGTVALRLPRHLDFPGVTVVLDGLTLLLSVPGLEDLAGTVITLLSVAVILLGLWVVVPAALPSVYSPTRPGFRAITAGLSAGIVPLAMWGQFGWSRSTALVLVGTWIVVAVGSVIGYHRLSGPLLTDGSQFRAPLDRFYRLAQSGEDREPPQRPFADSNASAGEQITATLLVLVGNAAVYAFPCLLLGGIVASTLILEPLFELMLVLFLLGQVAVQVGPEGTRNYFQRLGGVEDRFYENVRRSVDVGGGQGFVAVLVSLWGFASMAGLVPGTVVLLQRFATHPPASIPGWVLLLAGLVAGLYGCWYWSRQFSRLPDALGAWQLAIQEGWSVREILRADGSTSSPGPVTRPVDYAFGPLWTLFIVLVSIGTFPAVVDTRPEILLSGWLLLVGTTLATTVITVRNDPQPALADIVALPATLALHTLLVFGILVYTRLSGPLAVLYLVLGVLVLPAVYALPTLRRTTTGRRITPGTVVYAGIGMLGTVLWHSVNGGSGVFLGLALLGFVAGLLEYLLT